MSLTKVSYSMIQGECANVLDFGADPTGVVDSTAAFNAAAAAAKRVYIPSGTYSVSNVLFRGGEEFVGESRIDTILEVNTNNTGAFYNDWTTSFVVQGRIENISIRAKSGVTGARGFIQLDNSTYTGYTTFCNVETWRNLEIAYEGFFIYCLWDQCRDGYRGSPVSGQDHQFIRAVPAAYGQGNTTNLNRVTNSQTYGSSAADGYVFASYGAQWAFYNTGFESGTAPAINCNGILNVVIQGCWFEAINNADIIICNNSPAPNVQSSRPNWIVGNLIACTSANQRFVNVNGPTLSTITNNGFANVPVGMVLINTSEVYEAYANLQYSGLGTSLLTNIRAARDNVILRGDSEAEATFVNSPQTQNQNILPIGPTGLGASNFTNSGFTSITDIASAIGLAGNAVQFLCSSLDQIAYYQIPAKLVTFLQGKQITAVVFAYASIPDTAPLDQFAMRIWDSVVPSTSNHSATVTVTSTDDTNLATAYVTHTVSNSATSLYVGFRVGGDANAAAMAVESLKLVLGEIKATSPGLN